jgi:peptide/nickel transport system permease protein
MSKKTLFVILKRLINTLTLFTGIVVLIFFLIRVIPGDVVELQALEGGFTEAMKQQLRHQLGLDQSLIRQFFIWLQNMAHCNFGNSFRFHRPVLELFLYSLPVTLRFAFISLTFGITLGILLATAAMIYRNRFLTWLVEAANIWSIAVPTFCAGFIGIYIFVLQLRWMPLSGNIFIPVFVLGLDIAGQVVKPFYEEMRETFSSRFVMIARSKGLSHFQVVLRHIVPNSLTALVALSGLIVASTLGGSITMEVLFNIPGLGQLAYNAVSGRDYPVVQVLALFIAIVVLLLNFFTDIAAMFIDPRQRGERI